MCEILVVLFVASFEFTHSCCKYSEFFLFCFVRSPQRRRKPWRQARHILLPLGPLNLWALHPYRSLVSLGLIPQWGCLQPHTECLGFILVIPEWVLEWPAIQECPV